MNKTLKPKHTKVFVCTCMVLADSWPAEKFEQDFLEKLDIRVQYLENVEWGHNVPNPLGFRHDESDLLFAVHEDDVEKLKKANRFLIFKPKPLEEIYANGHGDRYPERIALYQEVV